MPHEPVASWQPDGDRARNYESYFVSAIFRPWAVDLVGRAALRSGEHVLDVACGTGIVSRLAASHVGVSGRVVGLDISPTMLHVANSQPTGTTTIEWCQAGADAMPFRDASFDVALCQQALQFFPDRVVALVEVRRVLTIRGRLLASTWRDVRNCPGYSALADAMERHVGPEPAALIRALGSLDSREVLERELAAAHFHEVVVRPISMTIRFPS